MEICLYLAPAALLAVMLLVSTPDGMLFGSMTDWINQHSVFPEYFRQLFYETGSLMPDFAMGLGGGQNIYNFSYYGLYNPLILPSYLLPGVAMADYLAAVSAAGLLVSGILFPIWLRGMGFSRRATLLASVCFVCAAPLLFHAHRHVMFVNYFPFLLIALIGVDRLFVTGRRRWEALICAGALGCLLTSYFYSAGCLAVLLLYAWIRGKDEGTVPPQLGLGRIGEMWLPCWLRVGGCIAVAVLMAGILLLPTGLALLQGGRGGGGSGGGETWMELLVSLLRPGFSVNWLLYGAYSVGLTGIGLAAVLLGLRSRHRSRRLLTGVLLLLLVFPVFVYLLNGTLYLRGKALIPFLPLYALLIADLGEWLDGWSAELGTGRRRRWLHRGTSCLIMAAVMAGAVANCLTVNQQEQWVSRDQLKELGVEEKCELVARQQEVDPGWWRVDDLTQRVYGVNQTYGGNRTSVYSSISNSGYNHFFYEICGSAIPARNRSICAVQENPFLQAYMGVKYLIREGSNGKGVRIEENPLALPLGWASGQLTGREEFEQVGFPESLSLLFEGIVVEGDRNGWGKSEGDRTRWFRPFALKFPVDMERSAVQEASKRLVYSEESGYRVRAHKAFRKTVRLEEPLKDKILVLRFSVTNQDPKGTGDINVTINGIKNKLSGSKAPYPNGNQRFTYVLAGGRPTETGTESTEDGTGSGELSELEFEFGAGKYELTDWEAEVMEMQQLKAAVDCRDPFLVDMDRTTDRKIVGGIQVKEDGYFASSLPYDRGFHIEVDGRPQEYQRVNTAFVGFPISAGSHEIVIEYRAPGKRAGLAMTVAGIGAALLRVLQGLKNGMFQCLKRKRELGAYLVFGVLTTGVNWVVFQALISWAGLSWEAANVGAWSCAVAFAYLTNRRYVFCRERCGDGSSALERLGEALRFVQSRIISLLLEMGILLVLIDLLGWGTLWAKGAGAVLVVGSNYVLSKWFVFQKRAGQEAAVAREVR